jgi:hypothetical protein
MNKGVEQPLAKAAEPLTASANFKNKTSSEKNGAWVIHPRPALQIVTNNSC